MRNSSISIGTIEILETRGLLSTATHYGTLGHDTIVVEFNQPNYTVTLNGVKKTYLYKQQGSKVSRVNINAKAGHDSITCKATGFDAGQRVVIYGEDGNDNILVKTATIDVAAFGGNGSDKLDAGGNVFYTSIHHQSGVRFWGGPGNDYARGGAGDDELQADSGNDTVVGGTGEDTLKGGAGSDIIRLMEPEDGGTCIYGGTGYDALETSNGQNPWSGVMWSEIEIVRDFTG